MPETVEEFQTPWRTAASARPTTGARSRTERPPRGDREAHPDADERGEEGVGERTDQAAHDEGRGQCRGATGAESVGAVVGGREVEDVLRVGEPDADHAGVDDAVEHAVELVPAPPQEQEEEGPLGDLLGDGSDDVQHVALGRTAREAEALEHDGRAGGGERAPEQAGDEQVAGLGLVAVEPHEAADEGADRDRREQRRQRQRAGGAGQRDDHRHDDGPEEHQCGHHDGERDTVAAASFHGSDPNGAAPSHPPCRTPSGDGRSGPDAPALRRTVTA